LSQPTGPVHFIYLGGPLLSQHIRAIKTARRHDAPIILWAAVPGTLPKLPDVETHPLLLPGWLQQHPIGLANVKDYYAYGILREFGGIYLDFDTITLRPAWDLLPEDKDLLVSTEYPEGDDHPRRNNSAVMIARQGAPVLFGLEDEALAVLQSGESDWGAIGPTLVSRYATSRLAAVIEQAPYRALNGWSYHNIQDYYDNPRDPGEPVRIIHLYSSSYRTQFENDRWMP
jgi:hypothetical protein